MKSWFSLHLYPSTKRGGFSAALVENKGYDIACEKHKGWVCKRCTNFKKTFLMNRYTGDTDLDLTKAKDPILALLNALPDMGYEYDHDFGEWRKV